MSDSVAHLAQFLTQSARSMLASLLPRREMWAIGFPVGEENVARPGSGGKNTQADVEDGMCVKHLGDSEGWPG